MQVKLAIALKIKRNKGSQLGHTKKNIYSTCNNARYIGTFLYLFLLQAFDPNEWCLENGLLSGGV
jgi:hypothetical protein